MAGDVHMQTFTDRARSAEAAGHFDEALRSWSLALVYFSQIADGWSGASGCLRALGEIDAAETLIAQAKILFPVDANINFTWANLPSARRDWDEMANRWITVADLHRDHGDASAGAALALLKAGRVQEARRYALDARQRFPENPRAHRACGMVLVEAKEYGTADEALKLATNLDALDAATHYQFISVAIAREEWEEAHRRLARARTKLPNDTRFNELDAVIRTGAEMVDMVVASSASANATSTVLAHFESLGGESAGCEFGFVQRNHELEPLGLLRWASIKPDMLSIMLRSDMDGLGTPGQTQMFLAEVEGRWKCLDTKYHIDMVTFLEVSSISEETAAKKMRQRLTFLRRKLHDDLVLGHKIFVYKSVSNDLDLARTVLQSIRTFGPGRLMWVQLADAVNPPGSVSKIEEGLVVGYIDRYGMGSEMNIAMWSDLCVLAAKLLHVV